MQATACFISLLATRYSVSGYLLLLSTKGNLRSVTFLTMVAVSARRSGAEDF